MILFAYWNKYILQSALFTYFVIDGLFAINLFSIVLFQILDNFWKYIPTKLSISLCCCIDIFFIKFRFCETFTVINSVTRTLLVYKFRTINCWFTLYLHMYVMLCAIWYHLYNSKNVKNTQGGVLLSVKLQAIACNFTKSNTPPWVFSTFFWIVQIEPNRATHHMYALGQYKFKSFAYFASLSCLSHLFDICTVANKNIRNMHAVPTNQIADILYINDNDLY